MATPSLPVFAIPNLVCEQELVTSAGGSLGELGFYTGAGHANALLEDPGAFTRWLVRRGNVLRLTSESYFKGPDMAAVCGLNCSKTALVRFSSYAPVDQYIVPTGLVGGVASWSAVGGGTVDHLNVDDGIGTQDALYLRTSGLASIQFSFPTPTHAPKTGEGYQHFAVVVKIPEEYARADWAGGFVRCQLYESGGLVTSLGYRVIGATAEDVTCIFPWDAADLAFPNGSAVEVRISVSWTADGSGHGFENRPDLGSVTWGCQWDQSTPTGTSLWDSGYLDVASGFYSGAATSTWGPSFTFSGVSGRLEESHFRGPAVEPRNVWHFRDRDTSDATAFFGPYLFLHVLDDGLIHLGETTGPTDYLSLPPAQVEPLEFGALVFAYAQELSCTIAEGTPFDLTEPSERKRTAGSNAYGVRRRAFRSWKLKFPELADAEAWEVYERLIVQRGKLRPAFVVLNPAATAGSLLRKHTSGYFYVTDGSAPGAQQLFDDGGLLSPLEIALEEAI